MAADRAWPRSVRVRTTAAAVGVLGVALLVSGVALVAGLHFQLDRGLRAGAAVRVAEIARSVGSGARLSPVLAGDDAVQVLGPAGEVVDATSQLTGRPPIARLAAGQSRILDLGLDNDSYLVVAASAGDRTVLLARGRDDVAETTQALTVLLGVGLPVLLLVVGATTWRLVGRALAPVDALRAEVDTISTAALHRRVPRPETRDEIDRLAATMNRMLDRLERVRVRERAFIADASHELRSPIAAIRQHAEVAIAHPDRTSSSDLAQVAHAESLRMQVLVDDLLLLARADEKGLRRTSLPVDLDDVVLAEAARLRGQAAHGQAAHGQATHGQATHGQATHGQATHGQATHGQATHGQATTAIDTSAVSPVRIDGDPAALARMLRNLVDNAARHATGRVALTLAERDGHAVIEVDDDGTGIAPADRGRVFDRFVRLDESRSRAIGGNGLGLAIVAEIAAAHGGDVTVGDSPLGGARFTVRLPRQTPGGQGLSDGPRGS